MIQLKTEEEMRIMGQGGEILSDVLRATLLQVRPGVTLQELDTFAENKIRARSAEPSFKKVPGYRWTICACVNDVVVHGVPDHYVVQEGDVVGIDCGVWYKGFHTDAAWTIYMKPKGSQENSIEKFLEIGRQALQKALVQAKVGQYIYDISKAIQDTVEAGGYSVVPTLVGHGVGRNLHEDPEIPGVVRVKRAKTPVISQGMVLAIEVIYTMKPSAMQFNTKDAWTITAKNGTLAGLFEATVAMTSHGCLILTKTV